MRSKFRLSAERLEPRVMLAGAGLTGQYFDNINLSGLVLTRTDAAVDFDWGAGAPSATVANETFSVRWSGQVQAKTSEIYTFYVRSDDGARLWVNGQKIIDNWTDHMATESSGTITLNAGRKYDLQLEYYDNTGNASAQLSWSSASIAKQVIPTAQLYPSERGSLIREYWNGLSGGNISNLTSNANYPNSPSGTGTLPSLESPSNFGEAFGERLRGYVHAPQTGSYTFWIAADNTAELYLSNSSDPSGKRQLASVPSATAPLGWTQSPQQRSVAVQLVAGQSYYLEALHADATGGDHLAIGWTLPDGTFAGPISGENLSPLRPTVRLALNASSANEESITPASFTVTRTGGSTALPVTIAYTLTGTSTNGADYQSLPGMVTISAGATSAQIQMVPLNDVTVESTETMICTLTDGPGYDLGPDGEITGTATLNDDDYIPAGGTSVLPADVLGNYAIYGTPAYGTRQTVSVSGAPFTQAFQIATTTAPPNVWDLQMIEKNAAPITIGDTLFATFWVRSLNANGISSKAELVLERSGSPYTKSVTFVAEVGTEWTKATVPFSAVESYAVNGSQLNFRFGYTPQTIQIGGISLVNYGTSVAVASLPKTSFSYQGRTADAAWRADAEDRIEQNRKGDVQITVRDAAGNLVEGAGISLRQQQHAFSFGTAVAADGINDTSANGAKYRSAITSYFNQAVLENDLKWGGWQSNPQKAINAVDWLRSNGITNIRGHNLVWPSWQYTPASAGNTYGGINYRSDPNKFDSQEEYEAHVTVDGLAAANTWLRQRVVDHIASEAGNASLLGKITDWDVVNEPYDNHQIQDILVSQFGGTANDYIREWFNAANAADPNARLFLNDYPSLGGSGHLTAYYNTLQSLLSSGTPLEGIGIQGHFGSSSPGIDTMLANLNLFGTLGLPMQITEYDIDITDEQLQADYLRDFLTLSFSHASIDSFLMWGFWDGRHWHNNAPLFRNDWSLKPSGQQWIDHIYNDWWTDEYGTSNQLGQYQTRGFAGDYEITVTLGNETKIVPFTLTTNVSGGAGTNLTINLSSTAPAAPSNLAAIATVGNVALTWIDNATNEVGYTIERSTNNLSFSVIATVAVNSTSYSDTSVVLATTYLYRVRALSANVTSVYSGEVSVSTPSDNTAPSIATPANASQSPVVGTATPLSALGADDGGEANLTYTWSTIGSPPASVTFSANGTNVSKSTVATFSSSGTYGFRVTVLDPYGLSTTSDVTVIVNQTVTSTTVTPATATITTSTTTQFTATARDQFGVLIATQPTYSWSVISGGGTINSAGIYTAPSTAGTATILATASGVSGTAAITIQVPLPDAPSNLVATKSSNRRVKLTWTDNANNETGFYVQTSTDGLNWSTISTRVASTGTGKTVSYTTSPLPTGKRYFRVLAYNATGTSSSNVVSITL